MILCCVISCHEKKRKRTWFEGENSQYISTVLILRILYVDYWPGIIFLRIRAVITCSPNVQLVIGWLFHWFIDWENLYTMCYIENYINRLPLIQSWEFHCDLNSQASPSLRRHLWRTACLSSMGDLTWLMSRNRDELAEEAFLETFLEVNGVFSTSLEVVGSAEGTIAKLSDLFDSIQWKI